MKTDVFPLPVTPKRSAPEGLFSSIFDEISEKILRNVPNKNKKYVRKQLEILDNNFLDYISYWNEKYYRNGFVDGIQLIEGCNRVEKG